MIPLETLRARTQAMSPWLTDVRRDFHMHPELGGRETRTSAKVQEYLREMGVECAPLPGSTAVVGLIRGGQEGPTVAIRADMDALPIQETNDKPYRSTCDGVMHACGHDAHTTILLGTAKLFAPLRAELPGNLKLLFQPAEETTGGAEDMVRAGCMKNPDVDYCIGLHVMAGTPVGQVEMKYGAMNGASDTAEIIIRGKKSHGAYPELGTDAVAIAAQVVTALQTLVSRNVSPLDSAVLTVGSIHGGIQGNIVADEVKMLAAVRTIRPATRQLMRSRITAVAQGVSRAMGGDAEVVIHAGYKALINSDKVVDVALEAARELVGPENIRMRDQPSLGVEDFSYFLDAAPGAFYHLGCANAAKGITSAGHTATFDIDESCLPLGVLLHARTALRLMEERPAAR